MPVDVSLFQKTIGGRTYAFASGDISVGDGETIQVPRNVGTNVLTITVKKRTITFTIRGASSGDIQSLYGERDNNITRLINATGEVAGEDITFGGDTIYSALLLDITAGAPISIGGVDIIEQVQVRFDSQKYV